MSCKMLWREKYSSKKGCVGGSVSRCPSSESCDSCKKDTRKAIVKCFKKRIRPRIKEEIKFYKSLKFSDAIKYAVNAWDSEKRMHTHQYRLGKPLLVEWYDFLREWTAKIKKMDSFEELQSFITSKSIRGVGPLTEYDTAFRIAAHMGILPGKIYLHSGVRVGAINLKGSLPRGTDFLIKEDLPKEFNELKPYEIEDLLCICKKRLEFV